MSNLTENQRKKLDAMLKASLWGKDAVMPYDPVLTDGYKGVHVAWRISRYGRTYYYQVFIGTRGGVKMKSAAEKWRPLKMMGAVQHWWPAA